MNVDDDQRAVNDEDDVLTFDDTSEFVRSILYDPSAPTKEPEETAVKHRPSPPTTGHDVKMEETDVALAELEAGEVAVNEEDYDDEVIDAIEHAIKVTEVHERGTGVKTEADLEIGTSGEKTHSSGLAATLTILRQQGILATPAAESGEREKVQLQRDTWLAEQRRRIAQRELERQKARGGNKDQSQREYENRLRDQQEARANLELFKDYKPDVNIVYHDEFGRELTPKEAWKALSHKFHGKGSGRMKTEKRLKKIAEERKQEAMVSGDTPLSMNQAFQKRQEKAGQAHFVLSVGNRGYAHHIILLLDFSVD
jgi:U4/U6.U5 tri-snRNP-associated protein 1